jgi:hypothetical protein
MIDIDSLIQTNGNSTLVLFILDISIVLFILYYLFQLRSCNCFIGNNTNELNLIFIIEVILLGFYILNFFYLKKFFSNIPNFVKENVLKLITLLFGFITIIYVILFYYFELLKNKVNINCDCFQITFKYLIYFQLIFFSVSYIYIFHKLFMSFIKSQRT